MVMEFILMKSKPSKKVIGRVLWYNNSKGYGVIISKDGESFFAHTSDLLSRATIRTELRENSSVTFEPDYQATVFNYPRAKQITELSQ